MSKATKAHSTTRRQILVAAPAAVIAGTTTAVAATASVTPELAVLWDRYAALRAIEAQYRVEDPYGRAADAIDQMFPIEEQIMVFPARTFGDAIILARVAWDQMTHDPHEPTPWDNFVKYLVPAMLRLDVEADQAGLDKWLADLNAEPAEA